MYATGEIDGYPYEILPYYKNGSLQGKKFLYQQLKSKIIPALNEGLKVLHDNGIIHKELKPSNIMLADNGEGVALIDFGISSIREDGNTVIVTRTGMTLEYSAPETFKNLFLSESDYYSLGITLYELHSGHTPYAQMSQDEIEKLLGGMGAGTPEPAPAASSGGVMSQEEIEKLIQYMLTEEYVKKEIYDISGFRYCNDKVILGFIEECTEWLAERLK